MDRINYSLPSVSIDIDTKANSDISQKQSAKSYASRIFQESTIGIISSILTTHSKYRRFYKIFLSSLCLTGFLYQCVTFLNHVFEYPTAINIAVDRSDTYSRPAYTFCNNNAIKRSVFCTVYPDHCTEASEEFCKKFSSYCGSNNTLVPMEKYYGVENAMSFANILKYGGNATDFFLLDRYHRHTKKKYEKPSGPYLRNNRGITRKMICFSLHSVVENNQQPLQKKSRKVSHHYPIEVLTFYVNETEMMNPTSEPGVLFSVHSPFEFVNPFERGIFLKGGRTYKFYLEMEEEILLKEPFETNCMDYEELWEKNNRTGPRTQKMCQEKCELDNYVSEYKCADYTILYPSKERICERNDYSNNTLDQIKRALQWVKKCQESCRDNCRLLKYTTDVAVRYQIDSIKDENPQRYIVVEIYLSHGESKVLSHSPKYVTVEVFSSIGGFMGCWLGIALLDILDVFGNVFTVCKYAFGKRF